MKLAFKKARVIFCLTSIYGISSGWSAQDREWVVQNLSDSPTHDGFLVVMPRDAARDATKDLTHARSVKAHSQSQSQDSIFWRYTVGLVYPTAKVPGEAPQIISQPAILPLESLTVTPEVSQNLAVDILVKADETSAGQKKASPLSIEDDEECDESMHNVPGNASGEEGAEDTESSGTEGGAESDTESEKSTHEDLTEQVVDVAQANVEGADSESTSHDVVVQNVIVQNVAHEDDKGERDEENRDIKSISVDSSNSMLIDVAAKNKFDLNGVMTMQPGVEQPSVARNLIYKEPFSAGEVECSDNPVLTYPQEGEGTAFFTQATMVALSLSAVIILPRLLDYWAKK